MLETANHMRDEEKAMLSGVILAGGSNRRMGGFHKALLPFQNEKLIQRQIRRMKQLCTEMILVTNEPGVFLPLVRNDVRIITDYYTGKGPLGGMHAAFSLSQYADIWLVGCDMPFISPQAAKLMLDKKRKMNCDAVIPCVDGRLQPLHGIFDKRCAKTIPEMLNKGMHKVGSFLDLITVERVPESTFRNSGIDTRFVLNVNTPEDYERALRMDYTSS